MTDYIKRVAAAIQAACINGAAQATFVGYRTPNDACIAEIKMVDLDAVIASVAQDEPSVLTDAHPDNIAVDRFAAAMKNKLRHKRNQGYDGWDDSEKCTVEFLAQLLVEHVAKGDPVDIANFAMMLHQRLASRELLSHVYHCAIEQRSASQGKGLGNPPNQRNTGVYRKYEVRRTDGRDLPGGDREGAEYFVLDVTYDELSKETLAAYARACAKQYPLLALDMARRYGLDDATPMAVPEGFALVPKNEFDNLMYWLDRCEDKGHLDNCSDLIEPLAEFNKAIATTPRQEDQP